MCGLLAILAKNKSGFYHKDGEILQQLLYADALRGWDATGVMGVNKIGNVDIKKMAAAAGHFCMTKQFEDFRKEMISQYQIVVGHNRKATHGEKKHADAHPFWDDDEKICLVHNGMISNHKEFCKESTVDSAAICNALASAEKIEDVISKIEGAFAFIWYNVMEKKLYFIRNESRPLYILETSSCYLLGSEAQMVQWICNRNNEKVEKVSLVAQDTLFSFDLETRKIEDLGEIKIKKNPTFPMVYTTTGEIHGNNTPTYNHQSALEVAPSSLYISDYDVNTIDKVYREINRGDKLNVTFLSYDLKGDGQYVLDCKLINVDQPHINIRMWMTKGLFDLTDLTEVHEVTVLSISKQQDAVIIYVNSPEVVDSCETLNGYTITTPRWFDDRFPSVCDVCGDNIKWADIKNSNVLLMDKDVISVVCPTCSARSEK